MSITVHCDNGHTWQVEASETTPCPECGFQAKTIGAISPVPPEGANFPAIPGFEIRAKIGAGGMGVVYLARETAIQRDVAIKTVNLEGDSSRKQRFKREGEAQAKLAHPNVVAVYQFIEEPPALVMEYVPGQDLAKARAATECSPQDAARVVRTLAAALQVLHHSNIIHRDLKPHNVLMHGTIGRPLVEQTPKVADFGLAKLLDDKELLTTTGQALGTPCYMSPEQVMGRLGNLGPGTDVYGLGGILYFCLTSRPPFSTADTDIATMKQVMQELPVDPRELNSKVPETLAAICLKCLEKKPRRRYSTAQELADDLDRFLYLETPPTNSRIAPTEKVHARLPGRLGRAKRWTERKPLHAVATGAAALVLLVVLGVSVGWGVTSEWARRVMEANRRELKDAQVQHDYFSAVAYHRGKPVGIGEVTESEASVALRAFRFHRRRGLVEQIDVIDRQGQGPSFESWIELLGLAGDRRLHRHVGSFRFSYDDGRVTRQEAHDPFGRPLWMLTWESSIKAVFLDQRGGPGATTNDRRIDLSLNWDHDGWLSAVRFIDQDGLPLLLNDGGKGRDYSCEKRGLITRLVPVSPSGPALVTDFGYDANGRCTYEVFLNALGEGTVNPAGVHRLAYSFPMAGKLVVESFDLQKQPIDALDTMVHRVEVRYLAKERRREQMVYGRDGLPAAGRITKTHREHTNYRGESTVHELHFFDEKGQPTWHRRHQCFRVTSEFDNIGNLTAVLYWVRAASGDWDVKRREDSAGRAVEKADYSDDGKKVVGPGGYHRWTCRYDEKGHPAEERVFDMTGKQCAELLTGAHCWKSRFSDRGELLEQRWFGSDLEPMTVKNGAYHKVVHEYAGRDRLTQSDYFAVEAAKRAVDHQGVARVQYRHDLAGNVVERAFWKLNRGQDLIFWKREDGQKRLLENAFLGPNGEPRNWTQGHHRFVARRDSRGNTIEEAYFGLNGEPVVPSWGYHRLMARFDAKDKKLEQAHFGINGEPCFHSSEGSFRTLFAYDGRGNRTVSLELGPNGKPRTNMQGWAKLQSIYGASDQLDEEMFWIADPDGNLGMSRRVDYRERIYEYASFTRDGRPEINNMGYHRWTVRFNQRSDRIEEAYFGLSGEAIVPNKEFHRRLARYDAKGKLLEEAFLGVASEPASRDGSFRILHFYDARGNLVESLELGSNGRLRNNKANWAKRQATYDSADQAVEWAFWRMDPEGTLRFWQRQDAQGRILEQANLAEDGRPQPWNAGHHRWTKRYDTRGKAIEEAYFDLTGKPMVTTLGYHRQVCLYNEQGKYLEWAVFGTADEPAVDADIGAFRVVYRYDKQGNLIEVLYLGPNGRPKNARAGMAKEVDTFDGSKQRIERIRWKADPQGRLWLWNRQDDSGREVETANLTDDGRPYFGKEGYHRLVVRYGPRGNVSEFAYFGLDGEPIDANGYHRLEVRYDEKGIKLEMAKFGVHGDPAFDSEGSFRCLYRHDSRGEEVECLELGPNGRARDNKYGWAKRQYTYDASGKWTERIKWKADPKGRLHLWNRADAEGNLLEDANLTDHGEPRPWPGGHYRWMARLDARGNIIEQSYFGLEGEPVVPTWGYHRVVTRFDEKNKKQESAFFGVQGEPAFRTDEGSFRFLWRHDARGNLVEVRFLGPNGKPRIIHDGWAKRENTYDSSNRLIERAYWTADPEGRLWLWKREDGQGRELERASFTKDGRPQNREKGYHRWKIRFDERGNEIETAYFGLNGEPVVRTDGYHRHVARFDEKRKTQETASFGVDGEPAFDSDDSFRSLYRYDSRSQQIECLELGPNGRARNNKHGWAKRQNTYDDAGKLAERILWKAKPDGHLYLWKREDAQGRILEKTNFTDDGQGQLWKEGFHRWVARRDGRGHVIEEAYFGLKGEPVASASGYHRQVARYDERGEFLEFAVFGISDEPAIDVDVGAFRILYQYDSRGNHTEMLFLGPNGRPKNGAKGVARRLTTFDFANRVVERAAWKADPDGRLWFWRREDANGRGLEFRYLDPDSKPILDPEGEFHRMTRRLDEKKRVVDRFFFGLDGTPVTREGAHHEATRYTSEDGSETRYYCKNLRPVRNNRGFHRVTEQLDKSKKLWITTYFGDDEKPTLNAAGYHRIEATLNESWKRAQERYLDLAGQPVQTKYGYAARKYIYREGICIDAIATGLDGKEVSLATVVEEVLPGSAGEGLDLRKGDVLIRYRGQVVRNLCWFIATRNDEAKAHESGELEVQQGKKVLKVLAPAGLLGVHLRDVAALVALPGR